MKYAIYDTVYAHYQLKPKAIYILLLLFLCLSFFILLFFFKIPQYQSYEGIYSCDTTCSISARLSYLDCKALSSSQFLMVDKTLYPLKIKNFDFLENQIMQTIIFELPEQVFWQNQSVKFQIKLGEETLFSSIFSFMKGGDNDE